MSKSLTELIDGITDVDAYSPAYLDGARSQAPLGAALKEALRLIDEMSVEQHYEYCTRENCDGITAHKLRNKSSIRPFLEA